jgi:hypothetical protein
MSDEGATTAPSTAHETKYGHNWCFRFQYLGSEQGANEYFANMQRLKLDANGWTVTGFREFKYKEKNNPVTVRDYFAWRVKR